MADFSGILRESNYSSDVWHAWDKGKFFTIVGKAGVVGAAQRPDDANLVKHSPELLRALVKVTNDPNYDVLSQNLREELEMLLLSVLSAA